jgi:Na+/H+ antiporter NhaD/arsenite permease-like protein
LNPEPYLIALATSANVGSACTIIGNPQNALIGIRSRVPFVEFIAHMWPVSAFGLLICFAVISLMYRNEVTAVPLHVPPPRNPVKLLRWLLTVSMSAGAAMFVLLCVGYHPPAVAMGLASIVIIAGSRKPRRAFQQVDWTLLFLFGGLFVVMRGVEASGLTQMLFEKTRFFLEDRSLLSAAGLSATVAVVSNLVSNVPAVMLYVPVLEVHPGRHDLWLLLAMASTLAGNLTLIGSIANLIVVEIVRDDVQISFLRYLRVGVPVTLLTLIAGVLILAL